MSIQTVGVERMLDTCGREAAKVRRYMNGFKIRMSLNGGYMKLVLFTILFGVPAFGQLFTRSWNGVPRDLRRCQDVAIQWGERLNAEAGVSIYWAGVRLEHSESCDVEISYLSESQLKFLNSTDGETATSKRGYGTIKDCNNALPVEAALIERLTGTRTWVEYCYRVSPTTTPFPFIAFVEAIVDTPWRFFGEDAHMSGEPETPWAEIASEILTSANSQGIFIAGVTAEREFSPSIWSISARFYSKERFWLSGVHFAQGISDSCTSQLSYARTFFSKALRPPLAVFCSKDYGAVYQITVLALTKQIIGLDGIREVRDPKRYTGLSECLNAVPDTERFYGTAQKHPVLGGFCRETPTGFGMAIFVEEPEAN